MKLKLDFSLYKGVTRLRVWWKEVFKHIQKVQQAINDLADDLANEAEERQDADGELQNAINDEALARASDDADLYVAISNEEKARETADNTLRGNITEVVGALSSETQSRQAADNALRTEIKALQKLSHGHDNGDLLDAITSDDIKRWNEGGKGVPDYVMDAVFGLIDDRSRILTAIDITAYDGGLFTQPQLGEPLDGGGWNSTFDGDTDCGDFSPLVLQLPDDVIVSSEQLKEFFENELK